MRKLPYRRTTVNMKKLTPKQKSSAKAMAKKAGRRYPNLVDNLRVARKKGK